MPQFHEHATAAPARVLVADDDALVCEVVSTKLQKAGYEVSTAADGEAALGAIRREMPDLLILDIRMPKIDGLEVCRTLREKEDSRSLPILMLTAYGGVDHIVKGLEAGADDYLTKPFHPEELLKRVQSLLRVRQIEFELRQKEAHLARVEAVGQLLVTLAHHINNSLAVIVGRAQAFKGNDLAKAAKLKESCLSQSRRIQAVLQSLEELASQMKLNTTAYAGSELTMFDLEQKIALKLSDLAAEA